VLLCHDAIVLLVLYSQPLVLEPSSTVLALVRTTVVADVLTRFCKNKMLRTVLFCTVLRRRAWSG
jgi:hypothetical protein